MVDKRYRYKKSPLKEVVFQLNFPTILSVSAYQPVEFQELIRESFPLFQEGTEQQNELTITPITNQAQLKQTSIKTYQFITEDGKYRIILTSTYISISTLNYTQWEDFIKQIEFVIPLFEKVYRPSFYTRIGLRYIDVITKSDLGLQNERWNDLIQPHVTGIMTSELENGINNYLTEAQLKNDDGTYTKMHFELVHVNGSEELSFLIDCDYFVQSNCKIGEKALGDANILHNHSSSFIRMAIKDKLHNAMEPVEI